MWLAVVCVCALHAAACDSKRTAVTGPSPGESRIVVLGDSLAISPTRTQAFPAALADRLEDESLPWTVINSSGSGDTTADGLDRLSAIVAEPPAILILALGANDGLQGIAVATVRANLHEIIVRAKAAGVRVLLCGMETPPLHGFGYSFAFHDIFPLLSREHDLPLVPFLLSGVIGNPSMNLDDGIHPNVAGARRIADNIWAHLRPML